MADSNDQGALHGVVGYFTDVDGIKKASRTIRDAGYSKWDTYTPFPVHGIDAEMGIKPTILPWIVLGMGLTGLMVGLLLQWFTNAFHYVFLISGKPDWSLPANIPVAFEVVIAFSAFTTFLGMLALNNLPHFSNPLHRLDRFRRVTDDRFALCVEASDPAFDVGRVRALLAGVNAEFVEECPKDTSTNALPMWLHGVAAILTCLTFIPLAVAFKGRFATSEKPRYHVWPDMDWQAKRKAQAEWSTGMFEDDRAMRLPVEGTIAVGELRDDYEFYFGVANGSIVPPAERYTDLGERAFQWLQGYPTAVAVDEAFLERGRQRYDINCSMCHGVRGNGLGSVALRAEKIDAKKTGWIAPKSLLEDNAKNYSNGQLFHIAGHGISTMFGYSSSVVPHDRWAIVAYVRALQATQGIEALPAGVGTAPPAPDPESFRVSDTAR